MNHITETCIELDDIDHISIGDKILIGDAIMMIVDINDDEIVAIEIDIHETLH